MLTVLAHSLFTGPPHPAVTSRVYSGYSVLHGLCQETNQLFSSSLDRLGILEQLSPCQRLVRVN